MKRLDLCSKCSQSLAFYTAKSGRRRSRCAPCDNARRNSRYHEQEKKDPDHIARRLARYQGRDAAFRAADLLRRDLYRKTPEGRRAYAEYQRRYSASEKGKLHAKRMQEEHAGKYRARRAVSAAVKSGAIKKPPHCSRCGATPKTSGGPRGLQGHHHKGYDEAHRLTVTWLCRSCHAIADKDGHGES